MTQPTDDQILDEFEKRAIGVALRIGDVPNLDGVRVIEGVRALLGMAAEPTALCLTVNGADPELMDKLTETLRRPREPFTIHSEPHTYPVKGRSFVTLATDVQRRVPGLLPSEVREVLAVLDDIGAGLVPRQPLTRDEIREEFLVNGFTVKEGQTDLKSYVYDAAYAILDRAARKHAEGSSAPRPPVRSLDDVRADKAEHRRYRYWAEWFAKQGAGHAMQPVDAWQIRAMLDAAIDPQEVLRRAQSVLASEIECSVFERVVAPAMAIACKAEAAYVREGKSLLRTDSAPDVVLNGKQLLEALDFIAPDRATDPEQLEGDVGFKYANGHSGQGVYVWSAEYPEDGSFLLDGKAKPRADAPKCSEERPCTPCYTDNGPCAEKGATT